MADTQTNPFANLITLVAVVGCQRSGTTLLAQILGAHPNAMMIDETDGLYTWFSRFSDTPDCRYPDTHYDVTRETLRQANGKYRLGQKRYSTWRGCLKSNITHLVLQAPNLTFEFAKLACLPINVKILYVVRDVRPVVVSMQRLSHVPFVEKQRGFLKANTELAERFASDLQMLDDPAVDIMVKRAMVWKIKSALADDFVQAGLPTHMIHYENLISDSREYCQLAATHAGMELHPDQLAHQKVYRGTGPGGTKRFRKIDQDSAKSWRSSLDTVQEQAILSVAQPAMERLGFDVG